MDNNSLYHHGIKGMRWGVRRFQNKNGTLTKAGKKRYADKDKEKAEELSLEEQRARKKSEVLESRSAKTLYENRKMFNYDEMNRAHKLLEVDDKVKKMIVEEPNKVKKFLTEAGDYATKIKGVVDPAVDIVKKINEFSKLFDDKTTNQKSNGQQSNTKPNHDKPGKDEPGKDEPDGNNENNTNGRALSPAGQGNSNSSNPNFKRSKSNTYYDADFDDYDVEWHRTDAPQIPSKGSSSRKSDIYDVDWKDITNTAKAASSAASTLVSAVGSAAKVAQLASSAVSLLPAASSASSETKAFISDNIAGYLPGPKPKEDD